MLSQNCEIQILHEIILLENSVLVITNHILQNLEIKFYTNYGVDHLS